LGGPLALSPTCPTPPPSDLYLISGTVIAPTRLLESAWPKEGSIIAGLLDAGHFMVASFCIAFLSWVGELVRVGRPWLGWIAVGTVATALGLVWLGDDVDGFSRRQDVLPQQLAYFGIVTIVSLSVVVGAWLGRSLDRNGWRWLGLFGGVALTWANGR